MKTNLPFQTNPGRILYTIGALLWLLLSPTIAKATEEMFYGGLYHQQLTVGASFEVTDTFPTSVSKTLSVKDMIWFSIDEDTILKSISATYWVEVKVYRYNSSNTLVDSITGLTLTVEFDPVEGAAYKYNYLYKFDNIHRFKVVITNRSSSFPDFMRLEGRIMIDRKYPFDCSLSPILLQKTHSELVNTTIHALQIGWQQQAGAEEYDLEWSFYDTLSPTITQAAIATTDFDYLFRNNTTRITTSQTWYNIPIIYPQGRIYWRVRGVRYLNGFRELGTWTSLKSSSSNLVIRKEWYWINPHEADLNWQMQSVFAEEGKKSQTVTYFDGSLRNRQKTVRSDAIDMIVASETIYDSLGRAALQVIPAPVSYGTGVNEWTRGLNYIDYFSAAEGDTHYSAADLSFPGNLCTDPDLNPATKMDSSTSAASRYYSSANPWKNRFMHKFIPASEDYPFSVTEYMADGTGRIRRQGGVGPTFQIGSGHETKYFYAKPDQIELDRLFGNEAGYAAHYQKNAVSDPNGQFSFSYIDAHGRTVATALAGSSPENTDMLPNAVSESPLNIDLLNNIREGMALTSTHSLLISSYHPHTTFWYNISPPLQLNIDSCIGSTRCYDCKYDLDIKILTECGEEIAHVQKSNFTEGDFDLSCDTLPQLIEEMIGPMGSSMPVGQYQIIKTLKVNESALNFYAKNFIDNITCLPTIEELEQRFLGDTTCGVTCETCYERLGAREDFYKRYFTGITPGSSDYANADSIYNRAIRACAELCDNSEPSDCDIMFRMMLADVSPGGQYANYATSETPDDIIYTTSSDVTSVFYKANPTDLYPFQEVALYDYPNNLYVDESGEIDYIYRPDSVRVRIDSLTINEFIAYFKPSWAKTLVKAHPEYCLYLCCKENSNPSWDSIFSSVTTYEEAVAAGYLPIKDLIEMDPFFIDNPDLADSLLTIWSSYTTTAPSQCSSPISLTDIFISIVFCNGELPCDNSPGEGCTPDNDMFWLLYQTHYISEKNRLKKNKMLAGDCPETVPANTYCKNYSELCFGKSTCGGGFNPYEDKQPRIYFQPAPLIGEAAEDSLYSLLDTVSYYMPNICDSVCAGMADAWISKLSLTCSTIYTANPGDLSELRDRFIAICSSGCDLSHPYGSVSTNGTATPYGDMDLQDAIDDIFFSNVNHACDTGCSAQLIDFPGTFQVPQYLGGSQLVTTRDTCACNQLELLNACWGTESTNNTLIYINSTSDIQLTSDEFKLLNEECISRCKFLERVVTLPPILECGRCKTYTEVSDAWEDLYGDCGDTIAMGRKNLLAARLNQLLGLNRNFEDYVQFLNQELEHEENCYFLCPRSRFPRVSIDTSCVSRERREAAHAMAVLAYNNLLDSMRQVFVRNYLGKCLGPELVEAFTGTIFQGTYQYTLYYYDQAGNLVRTVPPNGVNLLTSPTDLDVVKDHRSNPSNPPMYPPHDFVTRYWYNSLNQVVRDSTPDRGDTDYWYDGLGRLILSQNAKQRPVNDFTYTRYDDLGRVIETGRIRKNSSTPVSISDTWRRDRFEDWLINDLIGRFEVTQSYYDDVIPGSSLDSYFPNPDGSFGQTNLRNRIASITYEEIRDGDDLTYNYATHYCYDVSGNVKQLVQDVPELEIPSGPSHRFKNIRYEYDLVSGKVNYVYYQKDEVDQYIHHYVYDADNRIQYVETSTDSLIWERDANYEYYLHGPLGRTEIGERRVQGLDFAYTLQGWLKGMNASALSLEAPNTADFNTRDMGRDGKSGNTGDFTRNQTSARDVAAFTLGYYLGDYRKVNTNTSDNFQLAGGDSFNNATSNLFNGNIRDAVYAIARLKPSGTGAGTIFKPEGYAYKYDQLNRLIQMRTYDSYTLNTFQWNSIGSALPIFKENVTYDPNGNILTYQRSGNNPAQYLMDSLNYDYQASTNRLTYIDDLQTNNSAYASDLDDQNTGNYAFDPVGNIIMDVKQGINSISWTNAQKIDTIYKDKIGTKIWFNYDAMQNRVAKYEQPNNDLQVYATYYIRDVQGNVMATYKGRTTVEGERITWDSLHLSEQHIYGSSRVGMALPDLELYPTIPENPNLSDNGEYAIFEGRKRYEISNHLGNVLSVITDRKRGAAVSGSQIQWFEADVVSAQQYYPFGMLMPGSATDSLRRQYTLGNNDYRYGFNGKEGDDEVKGDDNQQDYGMRIYDPRVGRFLSVDPIAREYPMLSSYQFASNRPIQAIDIDGLEAYFNNSGEFVKWGTDVSNTAPVILIHDAKEIQLSINVKEFQTRVYFVTGEGADKTSAPYYAHTLKNAKAYGYHGEGFTEDKMLRVLWNDGTYKKDDYLKGLPEVKKKANGKWEGYEPYKIAFPKKDNFNLYDAAMKTSASAILNAEAGLSEDPTRGATNWGGGDGNYKFYLKKFGPDNIIKIITGGAQHNFFNLNTGKLNPVKADWRWHPPMVPSDTSSQKGFDFLQFPNNDQKKQ